MTFPLTGIENANDFYSQHYLDEVLDNDAYGTTRGSGVLRLTEDGWKIEQYVLSFAVPNDKARAVVDVIKAD